MPDDSLHLAKGPDGGSTDGRHSLYERFKGRLSISSELTPKMVSYRGNYDTPGFRWMRYKEGFSAELVDRLIQDVQPGAVLDPFSGTGTTPIVAAGRGLRGMGIEIIPVGNLMGEGICLAANSLRYDSFAASAAKFLDHLNSDGNANPDYAFPHVKITKSAFPAETELIIAKAREFISNIDDNSIQKMLSLACMSVLESVSFTLKDGQYLRWDPRSGKQVSTQNQKKSILQFSTAISNRLADMCADIEALKGIYGRGFPEFITGSSLDHLRGIPSSSFDMVITSPPYANRYDYTRTYALELAWLGYDDEGIKSLRQNMLSATVENKSKKSRLVDRYGDDSEQLTSAIRMYEGQAAVHEILARLRECLSELSNPHIVRMLEGYFLEMAVIIVELGRIVRPGGVVVMVNDNVQYNGEELPLDFILSDFAEESGFTCERIWTLPRGKGNASQQMGRFGRREQRKCVYWWRRNHA